MTDGRPILLETHVFWDERGFFLEAFNQERFDSLVGHEVRFVQDNHSRSSRGVVRGLHYQLPPAEQGKLVRVSRGSIFDVAVDIRKSSPEFGRWVGFELSEDNFQQLWIPPGFAHGFLALTDVADVQYKTTSYYDTSLDRSILWNDKDISIDWPMEESEILISDKDRTAPSLSTAELFD